MIAEALPATRQTLLFSATMTASLVAMQKHALQNAFHFQVFHAASVKPELQPILRQAGPDLHTLAQPRVH